MDSIRISMIPNQLKKKRTSVFSSSSYFTHVCAGPFLKIILRKYYILQPKCLFNQISLFVGNNNRTGFKFFVDLCYLLLHFGAEVWVFSGNTNTVVFGIKDQNFSSREFPFCFCLNHIKSGLLNLFHG